jgi:hypothetical protein
LQDTLIAHHVFCSLLHAAGLLALASNQHNRHICLPLCLVFLQDGLTGRWSSNEAAAAAQHEMHHLLDLPPAGAGD